METVEEIKWLNRNEAELKIVMEKDLQDEKGKVLGNKKEEYNTKTTADDLLKGIGVIEERLEKSKKALQMKEEELRTLGNLTPVSTDLARLEKNLRDLTKNENIKTVTENKKALLQQIESDEKVLQSRKKLLESRPED